MVRLFITMYISVSFADCHSTTQKTTGCHDMPLYLVATILQRLPVPIQESQNPNLILESNRKQILCVTYNDTLTSKSN
jgi:hypothetical protein